MCEKVMNVFANECVFCSARHRRRRRVHTGHIACASIEVECCCCCRSGAGAVWDPVYSGVFRTFDTYEWSNFEVSFQNAVSILKVPLINSVKT